ncbi:MAG: endonuclease, partial [Treponema sp.]
MTKTRHLRISIDITMTILSIILMGGNFLFPAEIVHEILGVGLFVLWSVHIFLNHRWYGAIFKGKYNPYRIMQTVINCCILICTIFLMISGIILSNHLFTFLNIQSGLGFARIAH